MFNNGLMQYHKLLDRSDGFTEPIYVTKPALPDLSEYINYLSDIWETRQLTNNGKYHQLFEKELADYLGVKYVSLFSNGTLALIASLQVLRITGEVITTPYSFVASTHALHWNSIKPVFCDIDPVTKNLDPEKIESLITPKTTAILPVHVYGNPCRVDEIQKVADIYGLKVIYDACHSFGVKISGNSILNYGDLSVLSFHATKVFTTVEGGAIICQDEKTKKRIDYLKNFGFADEVTVIAPGINAKMNEMQAALGLLQLKKVESYINKRKELSELYSAELSGIQGISFIEERKGIKYNYAYFPILINKEEYGISRDELYEQLKNKNIYARRYFYPLISHFPAYRGLDSANPHHLPVAERISSQILCLPLYPDLNADEIIRISKLIWEFKTK